MQIKGAIKGTSRAIWLLRRVGCFLYGMVSVSVGSCLASKGNGNYIITLLPELSPMCCYFHFLFSGKLQLFQHHPSLVTTTSELSCLEEVLNHRKKELSLKSTQIILECLYNSLWVMSVRQLLSRWACFKHRILKSIIIPPILASLPQVEKLIQKIGSAWQFGIFSGFWDWNSWELKHLCVGCIISF